MTIVTYAVFILSLRVILLSIAALGCFVTACVCWYEFKFHGVDGIVLGMRNLAFCLSAIFFTFLIVSVANLLDLNNQHLYLFAIVNTLTDLALVSLVLFFRVTIRKLLKGSQ
jgi:hypothetical protein